ncbi:pyruvate kinase [Oscillospiraceae bacterium MB08-C2-2]|nr:pyruvate kinase [Oscillospiraceae bacterium MB08-C2-2]
MRKTKIVCTLGLASQTPEIMEQLILAGMDVARFNFSHGTHESHKAMLDTLSAAREKLGRPVAALLDTRGPEVRLGLFKGGKATLEDGGEFTLTSEEVEGDSSISTITYKRLSYDVHQGDTILLDDGLIELTVLSAGDGDIHCRVVNGGEISNRKGVNLPGVNLSMPYISEADRADIIAGLKMGFDFIAASFVRSAEDIVEIRHILQEQNCSDVKIIAKIENAEGVRNIDDILRISDGIMVARGDMGVEIPFEEVPSIQKILIKKCYNAGKMVITATQMLDSMIKNPRPTRAEATDVANAIYDGTSAIMLSGETAAGLYPVQAVKTMARIAERTERDIDYERRFYNREGSRLENANVTNAIGHATCTTAYDLGATAIITVTISGQAARMISKYRPDIPILGCTLSEKTWRQLNLSWGVLPLLVEEKDDVNQLFSHTVDAARKAGVVQDGDVVVITTGVPLGISGTTNLLKVHVVGDVLVGGTGINHLSTSGTLCVAQSEEEAFRTFRPGDILVIGSSSNEMLPLLKNASAIVTEAEGINSHAAIVGMALDIPVIVGAHGATKILKSGTNVTVDAERGVVANLSLPM